MGKAGGSRFVVLLSTAKSREEAESVVQKVVSERLAACGTIVGPAVSIFSWKGGISREEEVVILLKTRRSLVPDCIRRIRELHSYEVPEVVALPLVAGSAPYLDWLLSATEKAQGAAPGTAGQGKSVRGEQRN